MKTESKRAEEKLRLRASFLSAITENQPGLLWLKDIEGRFLVVNKAFATACGRGDPEQVHGLTDVDVWPKEMAQKYRHDDQRVMSTGKSSMVEDLIFIGNHRVWYETFKTPVHDDKGRVIGTTGYARDITERKRAEDEIKTILRTTMDGFYLVGKNGRFLDTNDAYCRMIGYSREELLKLAIKDIEAIETDEAIKKRTQQITDTGYSRFETRHKCKDGKVIIIEASVTALKDGEGKLVVFMRDITERKRMDEQLAESGNFLNQIINSIADPILVKDRQHRWVLLNDAHNQLFGRNAQELLGKTDHDFFPKSEADVFWSKDEAVFSTGVPSINEEKWTDAKGKVHTIVTKKTLYTNEKGEKYIVGIIRDITERKQATQRVTDALNFNQTVLRASPVGIAVFKATGPCVSANEAIGQIIGGPREEVLKQNFRQLESWKNSGMLAAAETALATQTERKLETRLHTTFGKKVWCHCHFVPFQYEGELHLLFLINDITERKQVEERLREQAALLDAANDAIYVRTLDHTVTYWNDGAERLYGWTRAEALGRKMPELGDLGHEVFEAAHAALLEQGGWSGELKKRNKAGKEMTVFCRWTMLRDERGQPREILAINTDVTEQKQLEANFLRAQRMEGIGALAGGIAHDLNNILQPILMTAPLLRETTGDPESRKMLDTVESCAQRGADIIKQLLTFARGTPGARVPLPVRHLLRDMGKIIRETFPRNIRLDVDAPKDLWPVMGDATQVHQALMNLCVNARDAMPEGGTLTLTAKNLTLDEAFAAMMAGAKPGLYVCVSVTDSGMGIPPENLDRIFDPFFTTKEIGKGTGLGLATVLGIVRGHGGSVRVNSRIGKGTTFELYLPASPETKTVARPGRETLPPRAGGELILVVDDESSVRGVIQVTLEKHGYRVVTAAEGSEAIKLFLRHRTEVRVIITDMMMPGMDGPSLIRTLRHMEPQLPILGMTGVGEKADIKGLETLGLLVLLTKPFDNAKLLGLLHQALVAPGKKARAKP